MDIYEVVCKLVGPITPVGETHTDNERFENLKKLTTLIDELLGAIDSVECANKCAHEASRLRAAEHVSKFMNDLGITQ